jgi:Holliday junction resolvasome RuvABC endonuclease subunit
VDPSITNVGVAYQLFKFNRVIFKSTVKFVELYRPTLQVNRKEHLTTYPFDQSIQDDQILRSMMIYERIRSHLCAFSPNALVAEAGFVNIKFAGALCPLLRVAQSLNIAARDQLTPCTEYAPKKVKMCFHGSGNADKDMMKSALLDAISREQIILDCGKSVDELSEHEIDSIAIGYTHVALNRESIFSKYSE